MQSSGSQHWRVEQKDNNIVWLGLDKANSSTNTLNESVLRELSQIIKNLKASNPNGLVIYSAKKNGFIAGADINEFKQFKNEEEAFNLIREGQKILDSLASLPFSTVALIHGFCLGGGLELALACRYRVVDTETARLGLPEVKLGIHPGFGGTVRLPALINGPKALDLILTGKTISGKQAYKLGLADASVPKWDLERAATYFALHHPQQKKPSFYDKMTNLNTVRPIIGHFVEKKLKKVNPLHYPAPFMAKEQWVKYGVFGEEAYLAEAKSVSHLFLTDTSRNLIRVFDLQEKLKSLTKGLDKKPKHLHVIGAGVMGGDIAALAALKGMRVTVQDKDLNAIAKAKTRAKTFFKKKLKEPYLVNEAMDRLIADPKGYGIPKADILLEAIIEDTKAKQDLFLELEEKIKPGAIFATNTSTIPLEEISEPLKNPTRLVGIHFFNPVSQMPLVEVVNGNTDSETMAIALSFVKIIDKLPLPVKSVPGFLVNRVLMPYLLESAMLLEEGIKAPYIDKAMVDFGMPIGPIELIDLIGLDVCIKGGERLFKTFEGEIPQKMKTLVAEGHLGKKTGQGFYHYKHGKPIKEHLDPNYRLPEDVVDRLLLRMINECLRCLREGVVADADFLDAGMIFGAGFPPFRGGPIHYVTEQDENRLLQRLKLLTDRYGDRFLADTGWGMLNAV